MKRFLTAALAAMALVPANAADNVFADHFENVTLRLDYIFSGNSGSTNVALAGMSKFDGWAGKQRRLAEIPLEGNGTVTVMSLSGDTLYRNSFSTLYHEWIATDEATTLTKAMENTFLVPMPKEPVDVEITLTGYSRRPFSTLRHRVDPADILIKDVSALPVKGRKEKYIEYNGTPAECIDVVIASEGYSENEYELFIRDAERTVESFRTHEPFASMMDRFNFLAVFVPSDDSGVSIPRLNSWKSTAFSSHFSTFYSDRYLTTSNVRDLNNGLSGLPYEHIIVLANTDEYGGGGIYNSYTLTTAHHKLFPQVVVHEFGHSFGGLADEYFYESEEVMDEAYPLDVEPWEPNITTLTDFDSKWKKMLPEKTPVPTDPKDAGKYPVGVYEGGGYVFKGVYRPADQCRMRSNDAPEFCPVCTEAIRRMIEFYN